MLLHHQTWQEVEAYLARAGEGARGIIMPIGSTEQHGPNGLIGTDALTAEAIAARAGELAEALVGPTINVGMAQHHMAFAGSMTLRPSTLIAVISDMVESLARHGFDHFYFLNGHGGNTATVRAAFAELHTARSLGKGGRSLRLGLRNWWEGEGIRKLSNELYGQAEGMHATPSEVAVTQHLLPKAIKRAAMSPERAPVSPYGDAEDYRRRFPDGRIGSNPALATPEAGARIFEAAAHEAADAYKRFIAA